MIPFVLRARNHRRNRWRAGIYGSIRRQSPPTRDAVPLRRRIEPCRPAGGAAQSDENAALIVDTLWPLVQQDTLAIPRGGYVIRRGRIIVERARP